MQLTIVSKTEEDIFVASRTGSLSNDLYFLDLEPGNDPKPGDTIETKTWILCISSKSVVRLGDLIKPRIRKNAKK